MTTPTELTTARKVYRTIEVVHSQIYFSPLAVEEYAALGLKPRAAYFASRSAPMGAVGAGTVIATFAFFAPSLVKHLIPAAWATASPAQVLEARHRAAHASLRQLLGPEAIDSPEMAEAADIAKAACAAMRPEGRPLYAGHADLPWPDAPHMVLWHATSLMREHRGDGHIMATVIEGLDPVEALVSYAAATGGSRDFLQGFRGWSDDEWAAAGQRLRDRGLLGDAGLTEAGVAARARIEAMTDDLAAGPWEAVGDDAASRLRTLVRPFSQAIVSAGLFGGI